MGSDRRYRLRRPGVSFVSHTGRGHNPYFLSDSILRVDCIGHETLWTHERKKRRTDLKAADPCGGQNYLMFAMLLRTMSCTVLRQRSIGQSRQLRSRRGRASSRGSRRGLGLGGIGGLGRNQQPGKAGDRIGVGAGSIGDGDAVVGGHVLGGASSGSSDTVGAAFTNLPAAFFTEP